MVGWACCIGRGSGQPVELLDVPGNWVAGSGPSIDIDVDDLLGCENTTVGCGVVLQGPNGRTTIDFLLVVYSVVCWYCPWFVRRRDEDRA